MNLYPLFYFFGSNVRFQATENRSGLNLDDREGKDNMNGSQTVLKHHG